MRKPLAAIVAVLMMVGAVLAVTGGAEPHQHIYNAYRLLRRARYALEQGCRQPGGHRAAALRHIELAIDELKLAIVTGYGTLPAIHESRATNATPGQIHPYIHDALRQCGEAKVELETAAYEFGGHRVKAIRHVEVVIAQLERAVNYPVCH